jgi:ribosomal protein S18 acetylase RimI-like enzyme
MPAPPFETVEPTFKPAGASDFDALLPMIRALCEHDGTPFDEHAVGRALARLVGDESLGRVWLIESGGEAAGYVVLTFGFSLEFGGRDAFIDELFVKEEFRGRGLGNEAIRFAEDVCRERGIRALHLEVDRQNTRAQSVYRRAGFVDHQNYLMTKWL